IGLGGTGLNSAEEFQKVVDAKIPAPLVSYFDSNSQAFALGSGVQPVPIRTGLPLCCHSYFPTLGQCMSADLSEEIFLGE
ncbi:MAG: hypothetical protein LC775_06815, partial [Acidobacteria bacterium]|nr:hypothetical protein [Acidobacteriota bacterium]